MRQMPSRYRTMDWYKQAAQKTRQRTTTRPQSQQSRLPHSFSLASNLQQRYPGQAHLGLSSISAQAQRSAIMRHQQQIQLRYRQQQQEEQRKRLLWRQAARAQAQRQRSSQELARAQLHSHVAAKRQELAASSQSGKDKC